MCTVIVQTSRDLVRFGSFLIWFGSGWFGLNRFWFGSAWFGSVWIVFGSVRFGSVWIVFGLVQLGLIRFDSVRLGFWSLLL